MKSLFSRVSVIPASNVARANAMAAFNLKSPVLASDVAPTRMPRFAAMLRRRKKPVRGGSDGGPPAGMVMPDMSIGSVPFPA